MGKGGAGRLAQASKMKARFMRSEVPTSKSLSFIVSQSGVQLGMSSSIGSGTDLCFFRSASCIYSSLEDAVGSRSLWYVTPSLIFWRSLIIL